MSARTDQNLLSDKRTVLAPHSSLAQTASFSGTDPRPPLPLAFAHQSLGRYQVVRLLGQGAFGAVYLAEDTVLGRQVAVKIAPSPPRTATTTTHTSTRFAKSDFAVLL